MRPRLASVWVSLLAAAVACTLPEAAGAHAGTPMWSVAWAIKRIDGAKVAVGRWSGHVQSATTLCSGEGRSRRWARVGHWRQFTCTWTVFDRKGRVDRDVTFRVHTLTMRRFAITDARLGAG